MRSSIFNFKRLPPFVLWTRATVLAAVLVVGFFTGWELYVRNALSYGVSYNDSNDLWAQWRDYLRHTEDDPPTLIGASRSRFDIDLDVWQEATGGPRPVQLSINGASALPVFQDLADDPTFNGDLIISVTEGLFFEEQGPANGRAFEVVNYSRRWSPSAQASHRLAMGAESVFAFLQKEDLALPALINNNIHLPNREGARLMPRLPGYLCKIEADRREIMWHRLENDPEYQQVVQNTWVGLGKFAQAIEGDAYEEMLERIVRMVDAVRSRGGNVVFLRLPSSGPYLEGEKALWPREKYWDRLLEETNAPGIHFEDYEQLSEFTCPEWSHLTGSDATEFTKRLMPLLKEHIR